MKRLLERVRKARPLPEHGELSYTCSIGLAQAIWGESATSLLARADAALYQAKTAGRDRICLAD
jgi:PleD family two-component response regulator